jgi:hypothetical protein
MTSRATAHGKQLLLDGAHLADARSEDAAAVIAVALNALSPRGLLADDRRRVESFMRRCG